MAYYRVLRLSLVAGVFFFGTALKKVQNHNLLEPDSLEEPWLASHKPESPRLLQRYGISYSIVI
jgi:hypothetical protein